MARVNAVDFTVLNTVSGPLLIPHDKFSVVGVQYISGAGTLQLQASIDGVTFVTVSMTNLADGTTTASMTATGLYQADVSGMEFVRLKKTTGSAACIASLTLKHNR